MRTQYSSRTVSSVLDGARGLGLDLDLDLDHSAEGEILGGGQCSFRGLEDPMFETPLLGERQRAVGV
jgi:hypothetical protein